MSSVWIESAFEACTNMALTDAGRASLSKPKTTEPSHLDYVRSLSRVIIKTWENTPAEHRGGIERALFNVGVTNNNGRWVFNYNGIDYPI